MWSIWLWEGFLHGIAKVVALWWLVPLFIFIQLLKDSGWLRKLSGWMKPLLSPLRLPEDAGPPIAAGLLFGLTYGAGVIIQAGQEGRLTKNELTVSCVFLGICHALIEETFLAIAVGASGLMLVTTRVVTGLLVALIVSWWLTRRKESRLAGDAKVLQRRSV